MPWQLSLVLRQAAGIGPAPVLAGRQSLGGDDGPAGGGAVHGIAFAPPAGAAESGTTSSRTPPLGAPGCRDDPAGLCVTAA
jgi:hypothetical protein